MPAIHPTMMNHNSGCSLCPQTSFFRRNFILDDFKRNSECMLLASSTTITTFSSAHLPFWGVFFQLSYILLINFLGLVGHGQQSFLKFVNQFFLKKKNFIARTRSTDLKYKQYSDNSKWTSLINYLENSKNLKCGKFFATPLLYK